jgi:hypothetical protein
MDACPRDRQPRETAEAVAGILAMFAAMLALMLLC